MHFILNRDKDIASTTGRSVSFKKDVPTFVPPQMHKEVLALGAEPTEDLPEDTNAPVSKAPEDQDERDRQIRDAIEALTLANNRDDFNAGGKPNLKPLSDFVGWTVSAKERDRVLAEIAKA